MYSRRCHWRGETLCAELARIGGLFRICGYKLDAPDFSVFDFEGQHKGLLGEAGWHAFKRDSATCRQRLFHFAFEMVKDERYFGFCSIS